MKKLMRLLLLLIVAICTMTSCFKPEKVEPNNPINLLQGYWEFFHIREINYSYDILEDGSIANTMSYTNDYEVNCNDGNKEWMIINFSGGFMSIVATDDPDMSFGLNIPVPYTFDGQVLTTPFLEKDHGGNSAELTFSGDNSFTIYILDEGNLYDSNTGTLNGYEKYQSWTTFRRVTE